LALGGGGGGKIMVFEKLEINLRIGKIILDI
jgi:hypothetical protein